MSHPQTENGPAPSFQPRREELVYHATETASEFHADRESFFRGVMGPIGSGKSVMCCWEMFRAGREQPAVDGVRRTRWAIARNTYPELKTTTIKTWLDWFPEGLVTQMNWSPPITARVRLGLPDGTLMDMELLFVSLDKPKDVAKVLSLELTGAWMNEAREIPKEVLDALTGRVGRYPGKRDGGPAWSGIIADTNPPDDESWWYRLAEQEMPDGYRFFRQPGALKRDPEGPFNSPLGPLAINPAAENVDGHTLGYNYWIRQIPGKDSDWIKVYVLGEYGATFDGKPVYMDVWDETMHRAAEPLEAMKGLPLILGWDFGLTPACVICQLSPRGQLRVLREFVCERGGIREFARETVKPALVNEFAGMRVLSAGDPAGAAKSQVDERTCIQELCELGIPTEAAPSNDFIARRQAVIGFLTRVAEGGPGFLLDPSCQKLRKGFGGGYHFSRVQVTGVSARYRDVPNKNEYSHPHDALQYACMVADREVGGANRTLGHGRPAANSWKGLV